MGTNKSPPDKPQEPKFVQYLSLNQWADQAAGDPQHSPATASKHSQWKKELIEAKNPLGWTQSRPCMDVMKDDYGNSAKTASSLQGAVCPPRTNLMA